MGARRGTSGCRRAEELVDPAASGWPGTRVPKHVEIVKGMPLLPTGKVDKAALRRAFTASP